ncbi:hypothetical protein [Staphylococcus hominis]|uniref:hypothetical protein n=1 Tax=Staphylococcus hominis TaxID=1290 RepID=UPI0006B8D270|nr:hypothetical protein [Staphylococcus hominis]KPG91071.1 hypothetical protein AEQ58_02605 [Staphylococcus hominis]
MKYNVYLEADSKAMKYFIFPSDIDLDKSGEDIEEEEKLKDEVRRYIKKNKTITLVNGDKIESEIIDSFLIRTHNMSKLNIRGEME